MSKHTCYCLAYPFPHRQSGGQCELPNYCQDFLTRCYECLKDGDCTVQDNHMGFTLDDESFTIQERNPGYKKW